MSLQPRDPAPPEPLPSRALSKPITTQPERV